MAAKIAAMDAEMLALDAGGGDGAAAPSIAPTGPATEAWPRCACFANRDDDARLFGWWGGLIGGPVGDVQGEELARPRAEQLEDAGTLEVFEAPQYRECESFFRRVRVVFPAFRAALDAILGPDWMGKRMSSKNIEAALELFNLPPAFQPNVNMNSAEEAMRLLYNAFLSAIGQETLNLEDAMSTLERKPGIGWVPKPDVFKKLGMFPGGWELEDGLVTVEGMVAGNAAKELPPAVRETFGHQWDKLMRMLKAFDGYTKLLGGGNIPSSKLLSVYRALRELHVQVEIDDDCSILWRKVVSTATGREMDDVAEQAMLTKGAAKSSPYKIAANADKGDVAALEELLARVLKRAVLEEKGKGKERAEGTV
jgi:hypothetical protein